MAMRVRVLQEQEPSNVRVLMEERELIERLEMVQAVVSQEQAQADDAEPMPSQLVDRYVRHAVDQAITEQMPDDTWYAEVPVLPGVWAEGKTPDEALEELAVVAHEWTVIKVQDRDRDLPVLGGIDLNVL